MARRQGRVEAASDGGADRACTHVNDTVVLFARAPSAPGKTRLTVHLSDDRARGLREALLLDTAECLRRAGVHLIVAFAPEKAREEIERLVVDAPLMLQHGRDLGERMRNAMQDAFEDGADFVALIGSDVPTLPSEHVVDAFTMLRSDADLVLGPTEDGGFYLIAARRGVPLVFDNVEWGSETVMRAVTEAAVNAGLTVGFARPWYDVDLPEDIERLAATGEGALRTRSAWGNLRNTRSA
jgi:rSAM/selenodomain-associated transferase 1